MKAEIAMENWEGGPGGALINASNIETIELEYRDAVKLVVESLRLYPKLRLLDLYFGKNPLLPFFFKASPLSYFGFETANKLVEKSKADYQYYIRQRKAVFDDFDGLHIPYVMNFFHRVISISPRIDPYLIEAYLQEAYRVMAPGGVMVFTFKIKNYEQALQLIQRARLSPFRIDDLKILNMNLEDPLLVNHKSVFFVLTKAVVKKIPDEGSQQ
ncbi:hypothetical protein [Galbibacter pacificus]|uniref:Methyltransferase type 11 domain-containing protein n=1 Tax=Galbibacter pacificus TaxID=2996052 RepID=A0ABT6FN59_9FLAO|nr:hypothetical protein [Galbibacter pacificus]MDG3581222.1 hypothetical protein [Galbibacter pacificus]MDG3584700.1 hypothetical protein [Galbibacter pacificus]